MAPELPPARLTAIEVRALDATAARVADDVTRALSRRVAVPCRRGRPLHLPRVPMLRHRDQADADALLAEVEAHQHGDGTALVALTGSDLGHPLFTFFFGRARIGGAALISVARLDPEFHGAPGDTGLLVRRAAAEALHELGHVGGLLHCRDFACVMRFTGDVEMLDVRGEELCDACAALAPPGLVHRSLRHERPLS
jgi:archaemetzincin